VSELQESITVRSEYHFFRIEQARLQQAGVNGESENKQQWKDDESESNTNLSNLIQEYIFVHLIYFFRFIPIGYIILITSLSLPNNVLTIYNHP
jgi:hypothetical protein